jgi:putative ATP-binding cassette transporter
VQVLSLGEQQRLAFARIVYNNPSVVILDESTSALDLASEAAMYGILDELAVTYVSVGHRPSLLTYHSKKLVLYGPGVEVKLSSIDASKNVKEKSLMDLPLE